MESSTATADPWVGPLYRSELSEKRLLVVAEATPDAQGGLRIGRGLEAKLTGQYVDGSLKHRVFTDLARMILGEAAARKQCEVLFQRIAFANLSSDSSKGQEREDSSATLRQNFEKRLRDLEPGIVLILGERLKACLTKADAQMLKSKPGPLVIYGPHPGAPGFAFREHLSATAQLRL